jgi:DNA-binding NarL/FixJ family response regulator
MTIRILIADDHPIVRSGLRAIIASQSDLEVVAEAADGESAIALSSIQKPDVILMDLQMPGLDGATAIRRIRAEQPQAHILVLTTYDTDGDILPALDSGATGYLLKDARPEDLFQAIRATARGESALSPAITARLIERLSSHPQKALSSREIEVLELAARGNSNKDIGVKLHITEATVKSHLVHIFAKLGVADRTAAVTLALETGILRMD